MNHHLLGLIPCHSTQLFCDLDNTARKSKGNSQEEIGKWVTFTNSFSEPLRNESLDHQLIYFRIEWSSVERSKIFANLVHQLFYLVAKSTTRYDEIPYLITEFHSLNWNLIVINVFKCTNVVHLKLANVTRVSNDLDGDLSSSFNSLRLWTEWRSEITLIPLCMLN